MGEEQYTLDIARVAPDLRVGSVEFEGEGDFCRAYTVDGEWIFRFAYNEEGSRSLEREAALLPVLAPEVTLPVPNIVYFGRQGLSGLAFVGYRKIMGVELTAELLASLEREEQERCASDLAGFLRELHSFDVETARRLGVPQVEYPFSRTEEGIMQGSAAEIYGRELARLQGYSQVDKKTQQFCERIVDELLAEPHDNCLRPALVHGDLSHDHVLFDRRAGRIRGVIDFSDAIISTPLLDFVYLRRSYGEAFVARLLESYGRGEPGQIMRGVRTLHAWYLAVRLLWALDHDYEPEIERGLLELRGVTSNE